MDTTLLLSVNKNHPLSKKDLVTIKELKDYPIILMKEDCLQSSLVQNEYEKYDMKPNIKIRTNQLYTIKELIRNNNLAAFLFNQVIEHEPSIQGIKLASPIDLEIVIAYRKDANLNNLSKEFLNYIMTTNTNKKSS